MLCNTNDRHQLIPQSVSGIQLFSLLLSASILRRHPGCACQCLPNACPSSKCAHSTSHPWSPAARRHTLSCRAPCAGTYRTAPPPVTCFLPTQHHLQSLGRHCSSPGIVIPLHADGCRPLQGLTVTACGETVEHDACRCLLSVARTVALQLSSRACPFSVSSPPCSSLRPWLAFWQSANAATNQQRLMESEFMRISEARCWS